MKFVAFLLITVFTLALTGCGNQTLRSSAPVTIQSSNEISRALISQHKSWQGTPYQLGGESRNGIDCSAFTKQTYRQLFGFHLPRTTIGQAYYGESVHKSTLRSGDLVLFHTDGSKQRHVGIYVDDGVFLHASTSRGVTLSRLDNPYWSKHYWKAIRPADMAQLQNQKN